MDSYKYMEESLDDYCFSHYELAKELSRIFNLDETKTFSLVTYLNPKSTLYKKITLLAKYLGKKKVRYQHVLGRRAIIKEERTETDRVIGQMTATFTQEIKQCFEKEELPATAGQIENIDSFLYLINSNYFDAIKIRNTSVRREFLIDQLLYLITSYLKKTNKKTFDEKDAEKILATCIFIPEDIKFQIISEFVTSKRNFGIRTKYEIIRHDIDGGKDTYLQAKMHSNKNRVPEWNNASTKRYITLIETLETSEDFLDQNLGSAEDLSWEISFLQKMVQLADRNYRDELIAISDNYSNFDFAFTLIFNAMVYSVANEIEDVTNYVIINSFAECSDLPFDLKLRMIDEIFDQEEMDYQYHPYRNKKPKNKIYQKKIVPFKRKDPEKEE